MRRVLLFIVFVLFFLLPFFGISIITSHYSPRVSSPSYLFMEVEDYSWELYIEEIDVSNLSSIQRDVVKLALDIGFPPSLALGVVQVESRFDPRAVGRNRDSSYDVGLFQLNSRYFCPVRARNHEENIEMGLRYLVDLWNKFGCLELALLSYNQGPTRTLRGERLNQSEMYVRMVLHESQKFRRKLGLTPFARL